MSVYITDLPGIQSDLMIAELLKQLLESDTAPKKDKLSEMMTSVDLILKIRKFDMLQEEVKLAIAIVVVGCEEATYFLSIFRALW